MPEEPHLEKCPFCRGEARFSLDDDAYYCEDCGATPYVEKGCDPVGVWNTRPQTIPKWLKDRLTSEIDEIETNMKRGDWDPDKYYWCARDRMRHLDYKYILSLEESP